MRLTEKEKTVILQSLHRIDPKARVYLFGSRKDDNAKGGDIDLLICSSRMTFAERIEFKKLVFSELAEQKIDILISVSEDEEKDPFVKMAFDEGVLLK